MLSEQYGITAAPTVSHTLSTALDARLEFGLETMPEHRLKVILVAFLIILLLFTQLQKMFTNVFHCYIILK